MCSRVPISCTTHSPFGKISSSRRKETKPKGKNHTVARTPQTQKPVPPAPWSQGIRLNFIRRAICTHHHVVRNAQGIVLAISGSATRLVRRILCQLVTSPCLIHLSNLSFIRLLGDENSVLAPLIRRGHRDKGPRARLEPREVSMRSAHSQAQKVQVAKDPHTSKPAS